MKKVLINTPSLSELGGVSNHYNGLKKHFGDEVKFHVVGSRNNIPGLFFIIFDLILFIFKIIYFKIDLVVINPSLQKNALSRDALFLNISKLFGINVACFIHGWDEQVEKHISNNAIKYFSSYFKADLFIVLCTDFKDVLIRWGITKPIYVTKTKVDIDFLDRIHNINKNQNELVFCSRITKEKGIFIALDVMKRFQDEKREFKLKVIGNGPDFDKAKSFVDSNGISNVQFLGRLNGERLFSEFSTGQCYIFPSYHGEGMPTSVLEAMALGLPVVTTLNAGIKDFFVQKKMGYCCKMHSTESLYDSILKVFDSTDKLDDISSYNMSFAKDNFYSDKVAKEFLEIIGKGSFDR